MHKSYGGNVLQLWSLNGNVLHPVLCADDDDFSFETGMGSITLTFTEAGKQCVNVSIAMDNFLETSEHFSVVMSSRDDRVKLGNRISRIYIVDSGE